MQIVPIPKDESEVAKQAVVPVDDIGLDGDGLVKAAAELGLTTLNIGNLTAIHSAGKAMKKVGVLKIGRTMLFRAAEANETGLKQCEEVMEALSDPEVKAGVLASKQGFAKGLHENAVAFIKSAELDGNDDSDKRHSIRPFGAGQQAGPVVIAQQAVVNTQQSKSQ